MSAPAGWQPGAWRGLAFVTNGQDQEGGRRGVVHEFPQAEKPVWEDLGRKGQRYSIDCHIIGDGFIARAAAFADALNAPGAGTLVHPWYGTMQVAVEGFTRTDSTEDGGYAAFTIAFVETGLPAPAQPSVDSAAQAQAAAEEEQAAAVEKLDEDFSLSEVAAFVEEHAGEIVKYAGAAMATMSALQGGIGPGLLAIQANLGLLPPGVQAQLRDALALGTTLLTAVQSIRVVATAGVGLIDGLIGLLDLGSDLPPIVGDTPARDRQRANQAALIQMINLATAGEVARAIADTSFTSYDEAVRVRDAAADALDALALRQADAGDDTGADSYDRLRRAIVRDVTARGGSLARLISYTPPGTAPAIVIAHRLYGDPATVEARAAEIVARNGIAHPGFVPGGRALEVLSSGGDANG
ncbi:DNA circularization protein [Sphingomonas hengshuiensis]|uniref:DNA circulation N-terminal domain-containing protein n=1 Tax=Sphingomonas hengshuiensis TaxID=1609977 RepID=A0A7U4JAB8_9SPHN|nr:DNA circularization N-terminal domain-containing protein [Sphingomonas hengshuiensis]AJP73170.1 hypothetical protein TS85_17300 [Sphingomonas hengshuiensis]